MLPAGNDQSGRGEEGEDVSKKEEKGGRPEVSVRGEIEKGERGRPRCTESKEGGAEWL